jgi:hypothetical protein
VEKQQQLEWEARVGRPVAIASFVSALLLLAAVIYSGSIVSAAEQDQAFDTVGSMRLIADHRGEILVLTFIQAIATALLAAPLWLLYHAAKFRRPEVPRAAKYLALIAPPLMAIVSVVRQFSSLDTAKRVTAELLADPRTPKAANALAKDERTAGAAPILEALGLAATLGLAFAFVLLALNAMRAGLLSRFMGILGIIVGALFVLPLLGQFPFVQLFWTGAVGLLFLGRWPQGGRGPAWDTGEAEPWPTAQQRAQEMAEARAAREEEFDEDEDPDDEPARPRTAVSAGRRPGPDVEDADDEAGRDARRQSPEHPRSKKRKRKRR